MAAILPERSFEDGKSVVMVTRKGIIKKTGIEAYSNPRASGIIAISIDDGDELIDVQMTRGDQDIFLGTRKGKAIRFNEDEVREVGRVARGVRGISMDDDDVVVGMEIPAEDSTILTISDRGYGKRTSISEYRLQSRGGKGTINLRTVPKVGWVSGVLQIMGDEDIIMISSAGKVIRFRAEEVPLIHRSTQGVKLIELETEEKLVGVAKAEKNGEDKDDAPDSDEPSEEQGDIDVTPEE